MRLGQEPWCNVSDALAAFTHTTADPVVVEPMNHVC
jgi:hypothetical protein